MLVAASAIAGRVRWWIVSKKPSPLPTDGNQPRFTAKTRISTMAATNAGSAAEIVVDDEHAGVGRSRAAAPRAGPSAMPKKTMISDA